MDNGNKQMANRTCNRRTLATRKALLGVALTESRWIDADSRDVTIRGDVQLSGDSDTNKGY